MLRISRFVSSSIRNQLLRPSFSTTTSSSLSNQQLYQQKFRCPLCAGGTAVRLDDPCWMTGKEIDLHISSFLPHWNFRAPRNQQNNNKHRERQQQPLTSQLFNAELNAVLTSLPNTQLIDRVLVLDGSNVQFRTGLGFATRISRKTMSMTVAPTSEKKIATTGGGGGSMSFRQSKPHPSTTIPALSNTAQQIELLWEAFSSQRVCVVFVHEHLLRYGAAPFFDVLGALAEGSANVHDGIDRDRGGDSGDENNHCCFWRTRGKNSRLLGKDEEEDDDSLLFCDDEENRKKNNNNKIKKKNNKKMKETENVFRPWNSVTISTRRDRESGDFALFKTVKALKRILEADETMRTKSVAAKTKMSSATWKRATRLQTRIDVISGDVELSWALRATSGDSRVGMFANLSEYASSILNENLE